MNEPEFWLRGPVEGCSRWLMPAAQALLQIRADLVREVTPLTQQQVWREINGTPSVGFHLKHISGSVDRLLAYARGETLNEAQFAFLNTEREPGAGRDALLSAALMRLDQALQQIRATPDEELFSEREVGRARLKTSVFGLLIHIAEHTQRHCGQITTLARILRAEAL